MAIIIEEEKNRSGLVRLIGWVIIVGILIAIVYYVFFTAPQLVIIQPTGNFSQIAPIVQSSINPTQVLSSPAFEALKPAPVPVVSTSTGSGGRSNPFLSP